jgi:hypothetical protein
VYHRVGLAAAAGGLPAGKCGHLIRSILQPAQCQGRLLLRSCRCAIGSKQDCNASCSVHCTVEGHCRLAQGYCRSCQTYSSWALSRVERFLVGRS